MILQEQISRINSMMGNINETSSKKMPIHLIRRLRDFSNEKTINYLKESLMKFYEPNKKEITISKAFLDVVYKLFNDADLDEEKYEDKEFIREVKEYLENQFKEEIENFYDSIFGGENDEGTYCFFKHSELNIGLQSRGFSECIKGWHQFISKFGYWFPDLDWNNIKNKIDSVPNKTHLIKKPLENHVYHYYFSILKREQ